MSQHPHAPTIIDPEQDILHRLRNLEQGHVAIGHTLEKQNKDLELIKTGMDTLVGIFYVANTSKIALTKLSKLIKWIGGIAAAITAIYVLVQIARTGTLPQSLFDH